MTTLAVVNDNSRTDCQTGDPVVGAIKHDIEKSLTDSIVNALSKTKLLVDEEKLAQWMKEDPAWATFVTAAFAEMLYCRGPKQESSLCIQVSWNDPNALTNWQAQVIQAAPGALGPADAALSTTAAARYEELALKTNVMPSLLVPGGKYWASPGSPDTSTDMMWSGENHEQDEKALHGRVQA